MEVASGSNAAKQNGTAWQDEQRLRLHAAPLASYASGDMPSAEPVAIAGLASISQGWKYPAEFAADQLLQSQLSDGSVSVTLNEQGPFWTTSLACLVWSQLHKTWPESPLASLCQRAMERGVEYLLSIRGEKIEASDNVGHDTQLVGWPWVVGTHSWVEPTALAVMALRHAGLGDHPRTQEACRLLMNRWLPSGGANYGNTFVLGQQLRPHVLPTAMSVLALSNAQPPPPRLELTLAYLYQELEQRLGAVSLSWTALAMAVSNPREDQRQRIERALEFEVERTRQRKATDHQLNMLLLATGRDQSPLAALPPLEIMA